MFQLGLNFSYLSTRNVLNDLVAEKMVADFKSE